VHPSIPAAIRDLLATLDLYCDLSGQYREHLRDAAHTGVGRYALVLTLARPCQVDPWVDAAPHECDGCADQFVVGPLCAGCLELVAALAAQWTGAYPLATAEAKPWAEVAVLRGGRWGVR